MFKKGMTCKLKNGKNWMYSHLQKLFIVLFEEEETMRYLLSKQHRPNNKYVLVCRLGDYEDFKKYTSVDNVADRHKSGVYLVEIEAIQSISNSHVSNSLERLD